MKTILTSTLIVLTLCGMARAEKDLEFENAIREVRAATAMNIAKRKAAPWFLASFISGVGSVILFGQASNTASRADYAEHALSASYEPGYSNDPEELEGIQEHWLAEVSKYRRNEGREEAGAIALAVVSFGTLLKGFYELHMGHKMKLLERVDIAPLKGGGSFRYEVVRF